MISGNVNRAHSAQRTCLGSDTPDAVGGADVVRLVFGEIKAVTGGRQLPDADVGTGKVVADGLHNRKRLTIGFPQVLLAWKVGIRKEQPA